MNVATRDGNEVLCVGYQFLNEHARNTECDG